MPRAARFALLAVLTIACHKDRRITVDNTLVLGLVYGTVTREDGTPVVNAHVPVADRHLATCEGVFYPYGDTRTNSAGKYWSYPGGVGVTHKSCVWVYVNPPDGSPLAADSTLIPEMELRAEGVIDSVKVDFVLKLKTP